MLLTRSAGASLSQQVYSILQKYGTDAHVYLPGIGVINGLTAGNWLDSAGTIAATVDNPVGKVDDANGTIDALQATTANKPILRKGAVNLLPYSEQFDNAAWGKLNATVTANATTAPNGTSTMDKLVETAVSGVHYTRQSYAVLAGTAYTFTQTVYVKAGERNVNLGFTSASPYVNSGAFNPSTGAWVTANNQGGVGFSFVSRNATLIGDIWRISLTINISTASTQTNIFTQINLYNGSSDVYLGDGTSGAFIWGAMLNTGTLADYAPTTTAPASNLVGGYHWVSDSTDLLTATYPAGYESATIVNALAAGQQTLTAQNIVGAYSIGPSVDTYGRMVFRTGLTASELAIIQQYANRLAGV